MFEGDISLEEAIGDQISRLQSQKEELTAALEFCGRIKEDQLADVDPDLYTGRNGTGGKAGIGIYGFRQ